MIKKILKKIRQIFTNFLIDEVELSKKLDLLKTSHKTDYVTIEENSIIHNDASIINGKGLKSTIVIGRSSYICGTLLTFKYGGQINIGDWSYIGDHSRIWSGENITIGNNVLISHNVFITDTTAHEIEYDIRAERYKDLIKNGFPATKSTIKTKPIYIQNHVWINPNATILPGVTLGEGAIIAAGAVVTKDVAPFTMVAGNPAKWIKDIPH